MKAKFNLNTSAGVAFFEKAATGMIRYLHHAIFQNKPTVTAEDIWAYEIRQAGLMSAPYGADENGTIYYLADDMSAARMIYLRVAKQYLNKLRQRT